MLKISLFIVTAMAILCTSWPTSADNFTVDKIYHPYVLPFEREFEWRLTSRQNDDGNVLMQRFAFGHALSEYVILESYIVGARDEHENFGVDSYELELRWMITEQGKYWADWGALFEVEKMNATNDWAVKAGVLTEKEFGQFSLTTNFSLVYEWGDSVPSEWESEFKAQYRYRWMPEIQPGIEIYVGEDYLGVGPAFMGIRRFNHRRQLKWELGFIAGLNGDSKDHTLRMSLEYEF